MNRNDLIVRLLESNDIETKAQAGRILDLISNTITEQVVAGNRVDIGLCTFKAYTQAARKARVGTNPQNGEKINIAAKPAVIKVKITPKAPLATAALTAKVD